MTRRPPSFPPRSTPPPRPSAPTSGDLAVIDDDVVDVVDVDATASQIAELSGPADPPRVSDGLADRLAERRRARRRLRLRAVWLVAAAVVLLAGAGYLALGSSVLALHTDAVSVTGANEIVDEADVLAVVEPHEGEPLLRLDTPGLRQELLGLVGVLDVTVQRELPHGLRITIEPRVPVATVRDGGDFVLLDGDGVELARTADRPDGVPLVSVPVGSTDTAAALEAVLDVMSALPSDILDQVADASARTAFEVEFELDSGARVVWGSAEQNALKSEVLTALLPVPAQVYDVSAPLSPITR